MRILATLGVLTFLTSTLPGTHDTPAANGLFSRYEAVELRLTAPFADLLAKSDATSDYAVDGTLTYTADDGREVTIDGIHVSVRGNTSRQDTECTFPKLKLHFPKSPGLDASIFKGAERLKIGTHCGEEADEQLSHKYGRLANEHAVTREAFVYRLLDVLGVASLKARPARITYEDPAAGTAPLVRNAMLLEDTNEAMKRFHASREITMEQFGSAKRDLAESDTVTLAFAEAMMGNFDWCLRLSPDDTYRCDAKKPLWNIAALARDDGTVVPLIYDFDLAGMVTGSHVWFGDVLNESFSASKSRIEVEVVSQIQHTRSLFPRAQLDAARQRFLSRKPEALRALHESHVDARGNVYIEAYLKAFFDAIATDEAFYPPVVVAAHTTAYTAASGSTVVCPNAATIPVGTPVSAPTERSGSRVHVQVLDALWHWTGDRKCDAVRKEGVWIDESAIGTRYPN
jgi:hypothetical protein